MSNYLQNLILRASHRAPVLQRRRPALFEPTAPYPRPQPIADENSAGIDGARSTASPVAGAQRDAAAAPLGAALQDSRQAANTAPPAAEPISSAAMRTAEPASPTATPDNLDHSEATIATSERVKSAATRPAEQEYPGMPPRRHSTNPLPAARPSPLAPAEWVRSDEQTPPRPLKSLKGGNTLNVGDTLNAGNTLNDGNAGARPSQGVPRQNEAVASSVLVPRTPPIAQAVQLAKASHAQTAMRSMAANPSERDSVQISIGRVEVRAVPATEPDKARNARPKAPRLTLDDYLRERRGNRR